MAQHTHAQARRLGGRRGAHPSAIRGRSGPRFSGGFSAWWRDHLRCLSASFRRLGRAPAGSAMTIGVIGIALSLPAGLYVLLANVQMLTRDFEAPVQITLFLRPGTSFDRLHELAGRLRSRTDIEAVEVIPADEALQRLRSRSGVLGEALRVLKTNPLPHALVVSPRLARRDAAGIQRLVEELAALPDVHRSRFDMEWLERLEAAIDIGKGMVLVVGVLLALAVLFVVGNTVRLAIESRRSEIEVIKLVGATDAFVRRPFLYSGLWYGILGGALASLIVWLAVRLLAPSTEHLARLYGSDFHVAGLGWRHTLTLMALAAFLGWSGSWLAVGRHLRRIEPR